MVGLLIKLIVCPAVVYLADILFEGIFYTSFYQPIITGLVLAGAAHLMEVLLLRRDTVWLSLLLDFAAATGIVYVSQFFFPGAVITFFGAIVTAVILGVTEYFQHQWLTKNDKTKKHE